MPGNFITLFLLALNLFAEPEINPLADFERFHYGVYVFGVYSGSAELSTTNLGGSYTLTGAIKSEGLFDAVFPVRNFARSYIDSSTFYPVKMIMKTSENRIVSHYLVKINPNKSELIRVKERFRKNGKRVFRQAFKIIGYSPIYDYLTSLLFIRSRKLNLNKKYHFFGFSGNFLYRIEFSATKKEYLYTGKGVKKAIKVVANIIRWDPRRNKPARNHWKKIMNLWFSDDYQHIPLKFSVDLFVGSVSVLIDS
jgi:hypothetical protein